MGSAQSKRSPINYLDPSRDEALYGDMKKKSRRDTDQKRTRNTTPNSVSPGRFIDSTSRSSESSGEHKGSLGKPSKSCADIDGLHVTAGLSLQSSRRCIEAKERAVTPASEEHGTKASKRPAAVPTLTVSDQSNASRKRSTRQKSHGPSVSAPLIDDVKPRKTEVIRAEHVPNQMEDVTPNSLDSDHKTESKRRMSYKHTFPYSTSSSIETSSSGEGGADFHGGKSAPRLAPVDPRKLLLFVGQDIDSIADYANNIEGGSKVSGVTTYTALSDTAGKSLLGLSPDIATCPVDYGAGIVDATTLVRCHPHAALNLGLDITKARLSGIVKGAHDENLYLLGKWIRELSPRPVYLRIGYECDGPWNAYNPKTFPIAFAYIVGFLRNERVENFASVWQVSANMHAKTDIRKYWPGEEVVDWIGASHFEFHPPSWNELVRIARATKLPVLICEAAPQGYDIPRGRKGSITGDGSDARRVGTDAVWNAWFKPFFKLVHENSDIIRGISYINCNWESQSMWNTHEQGYWGNSVISSPKAPKVKRRWEMEVSNRDIWLQANEDLWTKELHP